MGKNLKGVEIGKGFCQRKDGLYIARSKKYGIELYSKNLKQLKKDFESAMAKGVLGLETDTQKTVSEWFDEWFDTFKAPVIKQSSIRPMRQKVRSTYMPYIGELPLVKLSNIDIQNATNDLFVEGKYSRGSIGEALNRLTDCLSGAVNARLIPSNPAYGVRMPYDQGQKPSGLRRWLSPREIEIFLDAAKNSWFYDCFYVMIYTGMRIGEIGGLKWSDIDFGNNSITLHRALHVDYHNGEKTIYYGTLKTQNSYRTIPMTAGVKEALLRQKDKVSTLKKKMGDRYRAKGEFSDAVFVSSYGYLAIRHTVEHAINSVVNDINRTEMIEAKLEGREPVIFERVYPHALRHTFASIAYQSGMDSKTTQQIMGHSHLSTTMDIYSHLDAAFVKTNMNKLDQFIQGAGKSV